MRRISELRRGRGLIKRAKRLRQRRRQARYAGSAIRSTFRAAPRKPRATQPYLGSRVNLDQLLG